MRLTRAARFFDRQPVMDGYSGAVIFYAQFSNFNDANAVGSTAIRRILSVAPNVVIPNHRILQIADERWIVGDGVPDLWGADQIRISYNIKKVSDTFSVASPGQMLQFASSVVPTLYGQKLYFSEQIASKVSSDPLIAWNIFFAEGAPVYRGYLAYTGDGKVFRIADAYVPVDRLINTRALQFESGMESCLLEKGVFSPVTDSYSYTSHAGNMLRMPAQLFYSSNDAGAPGQEVGDLSALALYDQAIPSAGDKVSAGSGTYRVVNVQPELDAYRMLLKRL